jgi:molybdenum cofactor cytidylyltransferase
MKDPSQEKKSYKQLAAVILAAGYSSRMGELKPLLPLGDVTVIEKIIDTFRKSRIMDVRVVVGHQAHRIIPVLEKLKVTVLHNSDYDRGMFSSVQTGVRDLQHEGIKAFFMMPVDYPLVKPEIIERLAEAYLSNTAKIIYPCNNLRRGHPPIISTELIDDILSYEEPGGLRRILVKYEAEAMDLELEDESIFIDIDTKADYEEVIKMVKENQG